MRKISKESQAAHHGGDRFYSKIRKLIKTKTKTTTHRAIKHILDLVLHVLKNVKFSPPNYETFKET